MDHVRVAIVGSGFAGLAMAIALREAGEHDFAILERADDVGGTWRDNTYPGCQCDVPSHLYSFSFAPNPTWSRTFSKQPEIQAYLQQTARNRGILPYVRFGHEVTEAHWDEEADRWDVTTTQGSLTADVLVAGMGGLSEPKFPDLPGLEDFQGPAFHTAQWDHDVDLKGKRVAVIGTGASAVQVIPEIQPEVDHLSVFQRTPPWVMPHPDRPVSRLERRIYSLFPTAQLAMRAGVYWARETFALQFMHPKWFRVGELIAKTHIKRQVPDPGLRKKLLPRYRLGCKRVLLSNDYFPALGRDNVEVITDGITEVRPRGVVTADGVEHPVDAIVLGTGFRVTDMPAAERLYGRGGRRLADVFDGAPAAHAGCAIAGYPNFFMLVGPNTGLGHNSIVFMIESQVNYVMDALKTMKERDVAAVDVRPEVVRAFNERIDRKMRGSVWTTGGCASWYLDSSGRNSTLWPGFTWPFRHRLRTFDSESYACTRRRRSREDSPQPLGAPVPAGVAISGTCSQVAR